MNHSAEIAALKRRLAALEAQMSPPAPTPEPEYIGFGPRRDGLGNVIAVADDYEARMTERRAAEDRHAAAEIAERKALGGRYIDPCGILREANGQQAATVAHAEQAVEEIVKQQFEERDDRD